MSTRNLSSDELRTLQLVELNILRKFVSICKKYDLQYFLAFGSVLGAVRHKGFIPWDDDIDVGMPRPDYDKFCQIAQDELGPEFFWQSHETDKNYYFFFGKIRLNGTIYKDRDFDHVNINHGIFIDIFPFEGAPDKKRARFLHRKISEILRGLMAKKWGKPMSERNMIYKCLSFLWRNTIKYGLPASWINCLWKWNACRYSTADSRQCVVLAFSYGSESYPREWLFPTQEMEFEKKLFACPKDCHEYLKNIYGDYMKIPPPEQRLYHPVSEFDLGKYKHHNEER